MSRFYSIKQTISPNLTWAECESQPVAMIMKLDTPLLTTNPERRLICGRCQYPEDNFIFVSAIDYWEYDMLNAFGVPQVNETFTNDIIEIFKNRGIR